MSKRDIDLPEAVERFVDAQVASGKYANPGEVIGAGLRLLQAEDEARAAKITRLKAAAQTAEDEIARGEGIVLNWDELDSWLDNLSPAAPRR